MVQKSRSLDLPKFNQSSVPRQQQPTQPAQSDAPASTATNQPDRAALPLLPKTKRPNFSSHRNDANAALALDLLADVESAVSGWHAALRQTLLNIQSLYMAGPIVDGWLEAIPSQGQPASMGEEAKVLRHGDANQVAAYIEKISQRPKSDAVSSNTQYRLCSLDADGQMRCQPCPPEQLGAISQAIARHQQLRQLLTQKQFLESRLKTAADALEKTRQALGITANASPEKA